MLMTDFEFEMVGNVMNRDNSLQFLERRMERLQFSDVILDLEKELRMDMTGVVGGGQSIGGGQSVVLMIQFFDKSMDLAFIYGFDFLVEVFLLGSVEFAFTRINVREVLQTIGLGIEWNHIKYQSEISNDEYIE